MCDFGSAKQLRIG